MIELLKEKFGFNRRKAEKLQNQKVMNEVRIKRFVARLVNDDYVHDRIAGVKDINDPSIQYVDRSADNPPDHFITFDYPTYSLEFQARVTFHNYPARSITVRYFDKVVRDYIVLVTRNVRYLPIELNPTRRVGYLQNPAWLVNDVKWYQLIIDAENEYLEKLAAHNRKKDEEEIQIMRAQRLQVMAAEDGLNDKEREFLKRLP